MTVTVNISATALFAYTTDPRNTPLWMDCIVYEELIGKTPELGVIYRNKSAGGEWAEYDVTAFEQDVSFTFSRRDTGYHVRYTFTPLGAHWCELEYYEWTELGELQAPLEPQVLERLQRLAGSPEPQ